MKTINLKGTDVLVEETERYMQVNDVDANTISFLWKQIEEQFPGYDVMFCFHNTSVPTAFLHDLGAVIADNSVEMRLVQTDMRSLYQTDTVPIAAADFDAFAACHDRRNPDMYWTSKRIKSNLSNWGIFANRSGSAIAGYILLAMWNPVQAEIFCVDAEDSAQSEALILAAAEFAFKNGKNEVLFMADLSTIEQEAAQAVGFRVTGKYQGYKAKSPL